MRWCLVQQLSSESILIFLCSYDSVFYSPDKLDPNSRAFEKLKNAKKFDPKRSSVLEVLNDQLEKTEAQTDADTGRKI